MDLKLVQRFLPYTLIAITTITSLLWSRRSRRFRRKYPERSTNSEGGDADVSSPPSSSAPLVREDGFQYHVFLSFRGPDTRKRFTSHLYQALKDKGIATFIDNEKLEKGQKVEELFGYIKRSKIFVPIFSKGYAYSKWCLKEITKIVECKRLIVPVFFDVQPNDVRKQTGPFAAAFSRYRWNRTINRVEVSKWSGALTEAGGVSGYTLADTGGDEAKLIQLILKRVLVEVNMTPIFVAEHQVGLDSRIADVKKMLEIEAKDDTRMIGIYGMGGMGKTTLSKAVYNQIFSHFDACSFISDIRSAAKQFSGLISLQNQLFHNVFKEEDVVISSTDDGISKIKERMQGKKILLVLDDVDHESQLKVLAGSVDWFRPGSRIIITTRDEQVLRVARVNQNNVYKLEKLDATQSLQLFSWHAFEKEEPNAKFADLSKEVASAAAGLPLALKIFGSHFRDLEDKEWGITLRKLKEDQDKEIHERLKISFDALEEKEKKVFLDIACFFIGQRTWFATLMWEGCKFFPEITIKVLIRKSLVNINSNTGEFEMHDHIRDMGRKIVEAESLLNPEICSSRLWKDDETLNVLRNNGGMKNIEAIQLSCEDTNAVFVDIVSFAAMSQLRMLRLGENVALEGEYKHFPRMLRWLKWSPKNLDSLPHGLHLENIVVLDLSHSLITQLWNQQISARTKVFDKLKVLNLSDCENLTMCPDFMSMRHLEGLCLDRCKKISELHQSIRHLKSLTHLSLSGCFSLNELPKEVYQLISLKSLNLCECLKISTLPCQLRDLKSMKQPLLEKLEFLSLHNCHNFAICPDFKSMTHLQILDFGGCHKMTELHPSVGHLKSLTNLSLSRTPLKELPHEFCQLTSLEILDLSGCYQLTTLPWQLGDSKPLQQPLLEKLKILYLNGCSKLTMCPDFTSMPCLKTLDCGYCEKMSELHPSIGHLKSLTYLSLKHCKSLKELPQEVCRLSSLRKLDLTHCSQILSLPSQQGDSKSLKEHSLENLEVLKLRYCKNLRLCPDLTSMPHLKKLQFNGCKQMVELHPFIGRLKGLTNLQLRGCESLKELPEEVWQLTPLKELDLTNCYNIAALPSQLGVLKSLTLDKLKVLKLCNCKNLTMCPDFSSIPHLKNLDFEKCVKLSELHPSIGHLKRLTHLSLKKCKSLRDLPGSMGQMKQLKSLILKGCHSLKEIHDCVCSLFNLEELDAGGCKCLASLPTFLGNMTSLWRLNLSWTAIEELPDSIVSLQQLKVLSVIRCKRLKFLPASATVGSLMLLKSHVVSSSGDERSSERQHYSFPQFPPSLTKLYAQDCHQLEMIADVSNARGLQKLDLENCRRLVDVPGIEKLKRLVKLVLGGCRSLHDSFQERLQGANLGRLSEFSIAGTLNYVESSYSQAAYFPLPNQIEWASLYLLVDESSIDNKGMEPDRSIESDEDKKLVSIGDEDGNPHGHGSQLEEGIASGEYSIGEEDRNPYVLGSQQESNEGNVLGSQQESNEGIASDRDSVDIETVSGQDSDLDSVGDENRNLSGVGWEVDAGIESNEDESVRTVESGRDMGILSLESSEDISSGLDERMKSGEDNSGLKLDKGTGLLGRVLQIDVMTADAQFTFTTLIERGYRRPEATFDWNSELMTMVREGRFAGQDRGMMIMRASINGCVLIGGDISNSYNYFPSDSEHPIVLVNFG